jgi:anthranilate phosphoribosyltransferase
LTTAGGDAREFIFDPAEAGISGFDSACLAGGTAEDNAAIARRLMSGEEKGGVLDAVCLNSGAGLFVSGLAASIVDGYKMSRAAFASGRVEAKMTEIMTTAGALNHA